MWNGGRGMRETRKPAKPAGSRAGADPPLRAGPSDLPPPKDMTQSAGRPSQPASQSKPCSALQTPFSIFPNNPCPTELFFQNGPTGTCIFLVHSQNSIAWKQELTEAPESTLELKRSEGGPYLDQASGQLSGDRREMGSRRWTGWSRWHDGFTHVTKQLCVVVINQMHLLCVFPESENFWCKRLTAWWQCKGETHRS